MNLPDEFKKRISEFLTLPIGANPVDEQMLKMAEEFLDRPLRDRAEFIAGMRMVQILVEISVDAQFRGIGEKHPHAPPDTPPGPVAPSQN